MSGLLYFPIQLDGKTSSPSAVVLRSLKKNQSDLGKSEWGFSDRGKGG
jgi:hypothetical protein